MLDNNDSRFTERTSASILRHQIFDGVSYLRSISSPKQIRTNVTAHQFIRDGLQKGSFESSASSSSEEELETIFKLDTKFIEKYSKIQPNWGFSNLGEVIYFRTYSRVKPDGKKEKWFETVQRVVEGTFTMLRDHIQSVGSLWLPIKAQRSAQEMYERMFHFKFLPPGRGLWAMGTDIIQKHGLHAALNNCGFVSTQGIGSALANRTDSDFMERVNPFFFLFMMSMMGVGVGFDTKGAGTFIVKTPPSDHPKRRYLIPDSRWGWGHSTALLLQAYFYSGINDEIALSEGNLSSSSSSSSSQVFLETVFPDYEFDYSLIRPKGEPIKTFGGVAPGPEPLKKLHTKIRAVLDEVSGEPISITTITDVMNLIGQCVLAGGVRRTAEIAFGPPDSKEFFDLKRFHTSENPNPRMDWANDGWGHTSNNSIFAQLGMDYTEVAERTFNNGEPGYMWLENAKRYGRMNDTPEDSIQEPRAAGGNPCLEQTLESYELCNLVETFPNNHDNLEDFVRTLKFAFLYGKVVTLGMTEWKRTNDVIQRNRRIGCSMTGIAQFLARRNEKTFIKWCRTGYERLREYDTTYARWMRIPPSIKITSIKPSGTVSLLAGATPGCHYPIARWYIRRVTFSKNSNLVPCLAAAGYTVEQSHYDKNNVVVEFPLFCGNKDIPIQSEVSPRKQLELSALLQRHWADNQVSQTVSFSQKTTTSKDIKRLLEDFQYKLKGTSFLPILETGEGATYPQMPYESISEEKYTEMKANLKENIEWELSKLGTEDTEPPRFCDGEACTLTDLIPQ